MPPIVIDLDNNDILILIFADGWVDQVPIESVVTWPHNLLLATFIVFGGKGSKRGIADSHLFVL